MSTLPVLRFGSYPDFHDFVSPFDMYRVAVVSEPTFGVYSQVTGGGGDPAGFQGFPIPT